MCDRENAYFSKTRQILKADGTPLSSILSFNILGVIFGHQKEHQTQCTSRYDEKVKFWHTLTVPYAWSTIIKRPIFLLKELTTRFKS